MSKGYIKIPKQIDAEVFLFGSYTVKQSFPIFVLGIFWYVGLLSMSDGIAKYCMTAFFALSAIVLGKRMGNLILYEYALLFIKYAFFKKKTHIKITRDKSLEGDFFRDVQEENLIKESNQIKNNTNFNKIIDDLVDKISSYFKK